MRLEAPSSNAQPSSGEPAGQPPEAVLQELSNDLMSPYCPGRTIKSCPSKAARQLEDEILAKAKAGETREEIETDLVARFGREIIGYQPPPLMLWGTVVLALFALVTVLILGRRWVRRTGSPARTAGSSPDPGAGDRRKPSRAELDALDDALDEVDGF
jgi:cytochrome c-type biogenesis protein CcmH/NrfF